MESELHYRRQAMEVVRAPVRCVACEENLTLREGGYRVETTPDGRGASTAA